MNVLFSFRLYILSPSRFKLSICIFRKNNTRSTHCRCATRLFPQFTGRYMNSNMKNKKINRIRVLHYQLDP